MLTLGIAVPTKNYPSLRNCLNLCANATNIEKIANFALP